MSIIREKQDLMDQINDINQILENEKSDEKRKRYRELLDEKVEELEFPYLCTNNQADYETLIAAIDKVPYGVPSIVYTANKVAIDHIAGNSNTENEILRPMVEIAKKILLKKPNVRIKHMKASEIKAIIKKHMRTSRPVNTLPIL